MDLNQGPPLYKSGALTAELLALLDQSSVKSSALTAELCVQIKSNFITSLLIRLYMVIASATSRQQKGFNWKTLGKTFYR